MIGMPIPSAPFPSRRWRGALFVALCALSVTGLGQYARAAGGATPEAVLIAVGIQGGDLYGQLEGTIPEVRWSIQSGDDVRWKDLTPKGIKSGKLDKWLRPNDASGPDWAVFARSDTTGRGRRKKTFVDIVVVSSSDGSILGQTRLFITSQGKGRTKRRGLSERELSRFFAPMIEGYHEAIRSQQHAESAAAEGQASGYTATTTEGGLTQDVIEEATVDDVSGRFDWTHADRIVHVRAYGQLRSRFFDYIDVLTSNLREYNSGIIPAAGVRAEVYPLRLTGPGGGVRRLGIEGAFTAGLEQKITVPDAPSAQLNHSWNDWWAAAVFRWDFQRLLLKASGGFGMFTARFGNTRGFEFAEQLPSVRYQNLRFALAARYEFEALSIEAEAAYFYVARGGYVSTNMFPRASVGGVQGRLGISRQLWFGFETFATVEYTHYYYDMRPRRGDEFIAGGAIDAFPAFELGVGYVF